jgi:outer membrane protein TolC
MSAQSITGLADVIRQARVALAGVPAVAEDIKTTTASVLAKVKQVQALTDELKSAEAELTAVIGNTSNGAPPLETTTDSAPAIPTPSPADVIHDDTGTVERLKLSI